MAFELLNTFLGEGSELMSILNAPDIEIGSSPSYQVCKTIYLYHPLGARMVETPIKLALSENRKITIESGPEQALKKAFERTWEDLRINQYIRSLGYQARVYGVGAIVFGARDFPTDVPMTPEDIAKSDLYFNVLDPLNTAGSLILNQDPNAPDFQKPVQVTASGQAYHPSRSMVLLHEQPMYIAYTSSGFGYVGRSVYQRALYPLKSFLQSMMTDNMVSQKAGLLIAKIKQPGPIVNNFMRLATSIKRGELQQGKTGNILSIDPEEDIAALNLQNTDTAMTTARMNIIENIATSADMPAVLLTNHALAKGFGEGTEDAKNVLRYINTVRADLKPAFDYFDRLVQYKAWSPAFYKTIQREFPEEYGKRSYESAFFEWRESFSTEWPSLSEEPEHEQVKVDKVKLEGICDVINTLFPIVGSKLNKAKLIEWAQDNINDEKLIFSKALLLDTDDLEDDTAQGAFENGHD